MDGENKKQSKTNGNVSNDWGETFKTSNSPSISDSESGSETKLEEIERSLSKVSDSSDIVSSPSSNSSSADYFQVNPKELPKSRVSIDIPKPNEVIKQLYKSGKTDVPIEGWHGLGESTRYSHESIFSDVTHESFLPHILPTQSPPLQMMERPGSFDPHKIPAFNRQSTSNWSTESNESLFSISIGNLSFSRDALRMSTDVYRTGELPKTGEFFKCREMPLSQELHRSGELHNCREFKFNDLNKKVESISFRGTLPAAEGVEPNDKTDASKNISEYMQPGVKAVIDKSSSDVPEACVNTQSDTNVGEPSKISIPSSADLIKEKKACPFCHCLYCCCCKWPSCSFRWSGCSFKWFCCCCSRSFCHLKCPTWSTCCECPSCACCKCPGLCCSCACCYCWRPKPHCDNCECFYTGATVEPSKNVTGPVCSTNAPLCLASSQVKTVA